MTVYRNAGTEDVLFRDDSPDKRRIAPGQTFTVQGRQHETLVRTLPGVEVAPDPEPVADDATLADLQEQADALGVKPASRRKADVRAAVVAVAGAAPSDDDGEAD
jgi:hypothetical protein